MSWVTVELQKGLKSAKADVEFWKEVATLESHGGGKPSKETISEARAAAKLLGRMELLNKPLDWTPKRAPACGYPLMYTEWRDVWGNRHYEECAWSKETCPNHSVKYNPAQLKELFL